MQHSRVFTINQPNFIPIKPMGYINEMNVKLLGSYESENRIETGGIKSRKPRKRYAPNIYSILGAKYRNVKVLINRFAAE